jgi:thiol-disulfide isomerase/thioredoxin/membrane protein YdbS with pleckstrin-like domain
METFFFLSQIALGMFFLISGLGKILDFAGAKKAAADFGVPASLAAPFTVMLSIAELAIWAFISIPGYRWYSAIAAFTLLVIFTLAITIQLARGNAPDCHCFGEVGEQPISWKTLLRNAILFVPAIVLVFIAGADNGPGLFSYVWQRDTLQALGAVSILALIALLFTQKRQADRKQEELERQLDELRAESGLVEKASEHMTAPDEGLPIGATVPDFELPDMNGRAVSFEQLLMRGKAMLFFFISPTCAPCKALLPQIGKWQEELAGKVDFIFVSSGSTEENAEKLPQLGGQTLLLQKKREVADLFKAKWTPTALLVNAEGMIASRPAPGDAAIGDLLDMIKGNSGDLVYIENGRGMSPNELKIGETLPEFALPDINGESFTDAAVRGKKTLVLFWGLDCQHCQRMLPEVKDWESSGENGAQLVVVSSGDAEKNRETGLRSPMLIDDGTVSAKLGMFGTPSAVLIDEHGKIASETAVGSEQIWSLIGKRKL